MKKGILSFLAGALASATVLLGTTAVLAASGVVQFNGVNISMNGQTVFSKEDYLKLDSGEYVPSSILYIDSKNGGTTYLPLAYISKLLNVSISWDESTGTIIIGNEVNVEEPDEFLQALAEQWLVDGNYPKNSKGETYGPDILEEILGYKPDLIAVTATNGKEGYLRQTEMNEYLNLPPEELNKIEISGKPYALPVYDYEGNVIGEFKFENG